MAKAIIFDMDGVIVDSEAIHKKAEKIVFGRYGITPTEEDWLNFKGRTPEGIATYLNEKYGYNLDPPGYKKEKVEEYLKILGCEIKVFDGFYDFVNLAKNHQRLALTTSSAKRIVDSIFEKFGLKGIFEVVVTGDDVENGKPNPEPYLKTIGLLGLKPEECVVIEDSPQGVESAKKAGAKVIGIIHTCDKEKLGKADIVVNDFNELKSGYADRDNFKYI